MKAIMHFADASQPPLGIWWFDPLLGHIERYYAEDTPLETRAKEMMLTKSSDINWGDYFSYLEDKSPYVDDWMAVDLGDEYNPQEYLSMMRKVAAQRIARADKG